jgi:hypothetical protein
VCHLGGAGSRTTLRVVTLRGWNGRASIAATPPAVLVAARTGRDPLAFRAATIRVRLFRSETGMLIARDREGSLARVAVAFGIDASESMIEGARCKRFAVVGFLRFKPRAQVSTR